MDLELMKFGKYLATILNFTEPDWQDIISKYHVSNIMPHRGIFNINQLVSWYFKQDPVKIRYNKGRKRIYLKARYFANYFAKTLFDIPIKELSDFYFTSSPQIRHDINKIRDSVDEIDMKDLRALKMILI